MILWLIVAGISLTPVVFGGPVAGRLAAARWTRRCPRAALVLWQAIGLSGGLGAVGVGLVAAVAPLAALFPHGMHTLLQQIAAGHGLSGLGPAHVAALGWSIGLIVWLSVHTIRITVKTVAEQRRQRLLVDVVADHSSLHDAYVLPSGERVAYCVPGRRARIVLSQGTLDLLGPQELQAVLGHERAHARGRHDLVLLPFMALERAFPRLPVARTARGVVPVLLEMLADDQARRAHGELTLARALVRMATPAAGPAQAGTLALADKAVVHRVERLLDQRDRRSCWAPAAAYSTAGLLLSGPLTVLVAPLLCITVWPV
ncbi:M56 family metallopeptidase [Streptosporangium canum]|uniref:M56 family metallopeptidase n=1 Tax=Streptosporangium canum TaxID=324952 RepID=UPI00343F4773